MHSSAFTLTNIIKTYPGADKQALNIDHLEIPGGCVVTLLGYNGSGKTTLLNLLGLIDEPDRGVGTSSIHYLSAGGVRELVGIAARDAGQVRRDLGFVFQEGFLLQNLPAWLNVAVPSYIHGLAASREEIKKAAEPLGVDALVDQVPSKMSGGQQQKFAFLRARMHEPRVLLADEPTSSLDPVSADLVLKYLRKWTDDGTGTRTVIWVTHNLEQAAEYADFAVFLRDGQVKRTLNVRERRSIASAIGTSALAEELGTLFAGDHASGGDSIPMLEEWRPAPSTGRAGDVARAPARARAGGRLMSFVLSFALRDVFPMRTGRRIGHVPALSMLTIGAVLALFFATVNGYLTEYVSSSIKDVSSIMVTDERGGDLVLTERDLERLRSLTWVRLPDGTTEIRPWKETDETGGSKITDAVCGVYGNHTATWLFASKSGRLSLDIDSFDVLEPVLSKNRLLTGSGGGARLSDLRETVKTAVDVFRSDTEPQPQPGQMSCGELNARSLSQAHPGPAGLVLTLESLQQLQYEAVPSNVMRLVSPEDTGGADDQAPVPVLGVVRTAPHSANGLMSEDYYRTLKGRGSPYTRFLLYVADLRRDGPPLCDALTRLSYTGHEEGCSKLGWIVSFVRAIDVITVSAGAVLGALLFVALLVSFGRVVSDRRRELAVLRANGLPGRWVHCLFAIEGLTVWIVSASVALLIIVLVISPFRERMVSILSSPSGSATPAIHTTGTSLDGAIGGDLFTTPWRIWLAIGAAGAALAVVGAALPVSRFNRMRLSELLRFGN